MTITIAPPETDIASGFERLAAFLRENPAITARMPSPRVVNIPLRGTGPEARLAELHDVAREMGTAVEWHGGIFIAAADFAGVRLEAHHNPESVLVLRDRRPAA